MIGRLLALVLVAVALSGCSSSGGQQWPPAATQDERQLGEDFFALHDKDWTSFPSVPVGAANFTTSGTYWNRVETAPGVFDFTRLDAQVEAVEEHGAQPMLVLGGTPVFHAVGAAHDRTAAPDTQAWTRYVAAVAERYGDRLDYQIWPEPNVRGNWTGTPAQMAELTALAAREIRRLAPEATIVSSAVALRLPAQTAWLRTFLQAEPLGRPTADWFDVAALDPFPVTEGTPEDSVLLVEEARTLLDAAGSDVPIWTNEINYGVLGGGVTTGVEYSEEQAAAYVARTYLLHADAGVERVYWLGWFDAPGMAIAMADETGAETSAGRALGTIRDWMTGAGFAGCDEEDGVHRCRLGDGEEADVVVWTEDGTKELEVPDGLVATTLDGRTVDPWRGRVTTSPVRVSQQ